MVVPEEPVVTVDVLQPSLLVVQQVSVVVQEAVHEACVP